MSPGSLDRAMERASATVEVLPKVAIPGRCPGRRQGDPMKRSGKVRTQRVLALLSAFTLMAAACGSDDEESDSTTATTDDRRRGDDGCAGDDCSRRHGDDGRRHRHHGRRGQRDHHGGESEGTAGCPAIDTSIDAEHGRAPVGSSPTCSAPRTSR